MGEQTTSQSGKQVLTKGKSCFTFTQSTTLPVKMARTAIFLFFLGLSAAHPQEGRAIGSGPPGPPVKGKNPNPLESRVAGVVKDDDPEPGASDGPQNVGKSGNWKGTPRFLLCDKFTSGSILHRANQIADHLAENEVRDNIKREMAAFDVDLLFAVVGGWNDNWNFGTHSDSTCGQWVSVKVGSGDDYQVFFVLQ